VCGTVGQEYWTLGLGTQVCAARMSPYVMTIEDDTVPGSSAEQCKAASCQHGCCLYHGCLSRHPCITCQACTFWSASLRVLTLFVTNQ
jgi:hypothetical protein